MKENETTLLGVPQRKAIEFAVETCLELDLPEGLAIHIGRDYDCYYIDAFTGQSGIAAEDHPLLADLLARNRNGSLHFEEVPIEQVGPLIEAILRTCQGAMGITGTIRSVVGTVRDAG